MTTPESIVVSIEMAKKLKAAEWGQDRALFGWCVLDDIEPPQKSLQMLIDGVPEAPMTHWYAAPTSEEILRELPICTITCGGGKKAIVSVRGLKDEKGEYGRCAVRESLVNAASSMWLWLKEHDLLTPSPSEV